MRRARVLFDGRSVAGNANDAIANARAGVAGRLAHEIIFASVDDDGAPDDRVHAFQFQLLIKARVLRDAIGIGNQVTEVASVTTAGGRAAVIMAFRVEVATGGLAIGARKITELMDVEAVSARFEPGDARFDHDAIMAFGEGDGAADIFIAGSAIDDTDGLFNLANRVEGAAEAIVADGNHAGTEQRSRNGGKKEISLHVWGVESFSSFLCWRPRWTAEPVQRAAKGTTAKAKPLPCRKVANKSYIQDTALSPPR